MDYNLLIYTLPFHLPKQIQYLKNSLMIKVGINHHLTVEEGKKGKAISFRHFIKHLVCSSNLDKFPYNFSAFHIIKTKITEEGDGLILDTNERTKIMEKYNLTKKI